MLDEEVHRKLVEESLRRYGTAKAVSRVLNEELKGTLSGEKKVLGLIYAKKVARTSAHEFEEFRKKMSQRLEH